jgi:chaperonin GroES
MTTVYSFTPLGLRILVQRLAQVEKVGSIYIPDSAQDKNQEGTVIALGVGHDEHGMNVEGRFTVKPGDRIIIPKFGGTNLRLPEGDFILLNEADVIGIVTPGLP